MSVPIDQVRVPTTDRRNHDGAMFSVLVTETTDTPMPGSDEINQAASDAWVGENGYHRGDGSQQVRALAFIGDVSSGDGCTVPALFVVDIPDDVMVRGHMPLCGTPVTPSAPPRGTVQRRLTDTTERKIPGAWQRPTLAA